MARYFLDSSALIKLYHRENGSDKVNQLLSGTSDRFFISRLALVEVHSCFARLVRENVVSEATFGKAIVRLNIEVTAGLLVVAAVSSQRLEATSTLFRTRGLQRTLRTLDAIHLATAEALHGRHRLAAVVAADIRMLAVAADMGLPTLDVS